MNALADQFQTDRGRVPAIVVVAQQSSQSQSRNHWPVQRRKIGNRPQGQQFEHDDLVTTQGAFQDAHFTNSVPLNNAVRLLRDNGLATEERLSYQPPRTIAS